MLRFTVFLLALLLAGCTVTLCHRFTQDLGAHVARADIVVAAVGKPGLIQGEWIKPGAIVIDGELTDSGWQGVEGVSTWYETKVGDSVEVTTPKGARAYEVLDVRYK